MKTTPEWREKLGSVSLVMARIHKMLFENEMEIFEKQQGQSIGAAARLQILLNSTELAWLRALSQLLASVDEIYFQKVAILPEQMNLIKVQIQELLLPSSETEFAKKYHSMLVTVPDLIVEHAHLVAALKAISL